MEANGDWLTVFQLPTYAPDLNPQEGIWSLVKRDIGNLAAADLSQITRAVKRKVKMLQYWAGGHRRLPRRHRPGPGRVNAMAGRSAIGRHGQAKSCWSDTVTE
nr:transposase [Streptomyces sp. ISL-10]